MGVRCDRPHLFEADEDLLEHDPYEEYELDEPPHISLSPDGLKGHVGLHSSGFDDFLLKPELIRGIQECGLEHPSEVQQQCIPHTVLGVDLLCQAKSGMGKTAVFVLAILQQMGPEENHLCALVLCHTRELSYQIHNEFIRFAAHMAEVRVGTYHGGLPCNRHREELTRSRPNIVVGTPGRVKQLALERSLNLKTCRHFVIDECDKMLGKLDMRADIQDIFKLTPHNKQVMMFAATLPFEIRSTCKKFMVHHVEFYVDDDSKLTLHGLTQYHVMLYKEYKFKKLTDLLDALEFNQVAIFVNTRVAAEELSLQLCASGFPSVCMYRGMPQEVRLRVYEQLKHNRAQVLVATDLMGRGVDIDKVDLVVNYDMPVSSQNLGSGVDSYLHRVGRAERFGTRGLAVTFVSSQEDADVLNQIQERFDTEVQPLPRWMGDDCKVHFVGCSPHRFVQGQDVMIT